MLLYIRRLCLVNRSSYNYEALLLQRMLSLGKLKREHEINRIKYSSSTNGK